MANDPDDGIWLQGADVTKPIFLRADLSGANIYLLQPNSVYSAEASTFSSATVPLKGGTDCPENICSGLIIGIEVPDSTGNGTAMRWYTDIPTTDSTLNFFSTCVPTEYFDENWLREYVIKLTPAPNVENDGVIRMSYADFYQPGETRLISKIIAPGIADVYDIHANVVADNGTSLSNNFMLQYTDFDHWPSPAYPSYVEGRPEINTPDPKTINLEIYAFQSLTPQPFTYIRGALVEGSDSIRHHVNLVNEGGDICFPDFIELVVDHGTNYVHNGGSVHFEGMSTCMLFRNGGNLHVGDGATLHYGHDGKGILALRPGSTIKLGNGSKLLIDNLLWLQGIPTMQYPDPQIYMDLSYGSSLVFGENANVYNGGSPAGTKLNVYMNGGTLDDSRLSPSAKALINRIYPAPQPVFSENIKLLQNPANGQLQISYVAGATAYATLALYDLNGHHFASQAFDVQPGWNLLQFPLPAVSAGMYLCQVHSPDGMATFPFVVATH